MQSSSCVLRWLPVKSHAHHLLACVPCAWQPAVDWHVPCDFAAALPTPCPLKNRPTHPFYLIQRGMPMVIIGAEHQVAKPPHEVSKHMCLRNGLLHHCEWKMQVRTNHSSVHLLLQLESLWMKGRLKKQTTCVCTCWCVSTSRHPTICAYARADGVCLTALGSPLYLRLSCRCYCSHFLDCLWQQWLLQRRSAVLWCVDRLVAV